MDFRLEDDLGFLMARTHRAMRRWLLSHLDPLDITYEQFRVLNALCDQDRVSQVNLAERVNADTTSLARMLDRMENAGLVTREAEPADSRVNLVTLTENGRQIMKRLIPVRDRALQTALQALNEKEVNELKRLLNMIYKEIGSLAPE
jgi:DNA-binding MarR family transcriptional regulator